MVFFVLCLMVGYILGCTIYGISKIINDDENEIKWLKQKLIELDNEAKVLKEEIERLRL